MANKRMFSMDIVDSDAFLDLPLTSQALYFHLGMRADDDGFVNNPMRIQRTIGANKSDFEILLQKRFIIAFPSGVIVIKHWKINNYIQTDRYKETVYLDEKALLSLKENKSYTECTTKCIQDVSNLDAQNRLDKNREEEISIEQNSNTPENDEQPKKKKEDILNGRSTKFIEAFKEFRKMRNGMRAKMTSNAERLIIQKLEKLASDESEQIAILEQSIANSYRGVFPLKKDNPSKSNQLTYTEKTEEELWRDYTEGMEAYGNWNR